MYTLHILYVHIVSTQLIQYKNTHIVMRIKIHVCTVVINKKTTEQFLQRLPKYSTNTAVTIWSVKLIDLSYMSSLHINRQGNLAIGYKCLPMIG